MRSGIHAPIGKGDQMVSHAQIMNGTDSERSTETTVFDLRETIRGSRLATLWSILSGYRLLYFLAIIFLALGAIMNTLSFNILRVFVDDVLPMPPEALLGGLIIVALAFIGVTLLRGGFSFLSGRLAAQTSEGLALRIKDFMYDHIQRLSFSYHDTMATGELIQRCTSDIDAVRRFFAEQAIEIGRILSLFLINFVAIALLDFRLAVLSVIVVPVVVLVSVLFFRRVSKAYDVFQDQEAKLSTTLQENVTGVRVVKAFSRQDFEIDRFEKENLRKYALGRNLMMMHAMFWPFLDLITGAQLVLGYLLAAMMVINGDLTIGAYVAYTGMVIYIIFPIRGLGRAIVQMSTGLVSLERVREIVVQEQVDLGINEVPPRQAIEGNLEIEGLFFRYSSGPVVLDNINLQIRPGMSVALLGATGSGKSTLVSLLMRFYDYAEGSIKLDGIELNHYPRHFLRQQIGIVEQEPFLFSRTIRENIAFGVNQPVDNAEVERAAKAAAIHNAIMTFPEGYETLVGERGVTLSGGQKQRVALARTILKDPRILILDDATSSVDTETESAIRASLTDLMDSRTTLIIAHRIQSAMNADLIVVLEEGRIVQMGQHEDLLAVDGIYKQTYDLQARIELELAQEVDYV
jgi:ATP-binding cassette, subfamily B, bacterial